jgi:hypothetical protein
MIDRKMEESQNKQLTSPRSHTATRTYSPENSPNPKYRPPEQPEDQQTEDPRTTDRTDRKPRTADKHSQKYALRAVSCV